MQPVPYFKIKLINSSFLIFFLFLSQLFGEDYYTQARFFYNHLVEKNDLLYRPFTNEPVYGDIYMYFLNNGRRTENIFLGVITKKGKQGHWRRYWENGNKKDEGYYTNSKKEGLWIEWREDGQKFAEIFYKDGIATHLTNCIIENCP